MSRIRSIHPGLWTDEAFMSLSAHGRLLLIGLWTEAYDDGVFEWKPLTLKARLFPVDAVDVNDLLCELVEAGVIARLVSVPKQPGVIRNFQKFQRPKKPNSSGMLPDEWREYVGASGTPASSDDDSSEPVPHQFPTGTEKSPQMEDGGGRGKEEDVSQAQHPPPAGVRDDALEAEFNQVWTDFPRHPNSRRFAALRAFRNLSKPERLACIRGVARYALAFEDDRADKRPMPDRLRYVPHLVTWIHQRGWEAVLEQVA